MKKNFCLLIIVVIALLICSSLVTAQPSYEIIFGHHLPTSTMQHKAVEKFVELCDEKTDGQVVINVIHSGQLGGQREIIEAVKLGSIQMGYGESAIYVGYFDEFGVLSLPFLFDDLNHYHKMADGEIGAYLAENLESKTGLRIIGWVDGGIRDTYLTDKKIESVSDFKGVKIRTPESPVFVNTFKSLGANPTPVPATEMYSALQSGVVDAMEGTEEVAWTFKIYEVAKYCALTRHINTDLSFVVNSDYLESLPEDIQTAILEAADESAQWQRQQWSENLSVFKDKLADEGDVEFIEVDLDEFRNSVKPMYKEQYEATPAIEELVANIKDLK